ncbi:NAD(P)-dependent oxidoreductase [Nocardioides sp. InS609-2]|uniref:NAD-dependent epimerase/dehydratase family protein n=1 Tax=Nocardioides sp. InS609-2 TaxID=2760705 RepID=UPI0020C13D5D|nr:NAD(P)-dependent oxidoreductase [Nocardioides sp. InS609-2]
MTGATGFVGRRVVAALSRDGYRVRALGRTRSAGLPSGVDHAVWDLESGGDLGALADLGALVHAAAYIPRSQASSDEAERCWRLNALGTLRLFEAANVASVGHVVHLSTGNSYRPLSREVVEDDALFPSSSAPYYLSSKVCAEIFADHLRRTSDLQLAILRLSSVFGPGMTPGGLVWSFVDHLSRGERITILDGGRFQTDLVFVDDVVAAIVGAVRQRADGIFNVGSGRPTSVLQLALELLSLTGHGQDLIEIHDAVDRPTSVGYSALNISKARDKLNYSPRTLREGLHSYLSALAS